MSMAAEAAFEAPATTMEADPRRARPRPERAAGAPQTALAGEPALPLESALRYRLDAATFAALQAHPRLGEAASARRSREIRDYFDTEFNDLGRAGLALSLRRARAKTRMALEYGGGVAFARGVVETQIPGEVPAPGLFAPDAARLIAATTQGRPLRPQFRLETWRVSRAATFDAAHFDVVFMEGRIVAGVEREAFFEIEIVLKSGAPAALFRLGLVLVEAGLTRLSPQSAAERGFRLASGLAETPARARLLDFGPQTTLDEAAGALLRNGLAQLLGNLPAMDGPEAGEAVHQIRVALRRLRSALGLLRPMFGCSEIETLRVAAKVIADAFGDARDWDVFGMMVEAGPKAALPEILGFSALLEHAAAKTAAARRQAVEALRGAAATRFVLSLQLFIVRRGWRNAAPDNQLQALAAPAAPFASRALDRLYTRVRKRGRGFDTLASEPRHRLRIALKQLRYACEFFSSLYRSPARARHFAKAAAELQDLLGVANDGDVARRRIASLDWTGDPALGFAAGAVAGWCGRDAQLDARVLRKAWRRFRRAESFWREDERPASERNGAAV